VNGFEFDDGLHGRSGRGRSTTAGAAEGTARSGSG
jgi:hypothetical protein